MSGSLDIADGKPVTVASFFKPRDLSMAILAALLVAILTGAASTILFFPGLILAVLLRFTMPLVIDRSFSATQALGSSVSAAWAHIGGALLAWLLQIAVIIVGALACGVGLLIAVPVATLILTYTYRKLPADRSLSSPGRVTNSGLPPCRRGRNTPNTPVRAPPRHFC